jgi:biphenyl 2,3-dioxygenase beta subunit
MSGSGIMPRTRLATADWEMLREVEHFLVREAWLLDHDHLEQWLALLSPGIRYFAPVRGNVARRVDEGFGTPGRAAHFDDTIDSLTLRVRRLRTGRAWAEDPASRVRRFVSNVLLLESGEASVAVGSNLMIHREGVTGPARSLVAYREDWLERTDDGCLRIAARTIHLDHLAVPPLSLLL